MEQNRTEQKSHSERDPQRSSSSTAWLLQAWHSNILINGIVINTHTDRDGALPPLSPGRRFQCLSTLLVKKCSNAQSESLLKQLWTIPVTGCQGRDQHFPLHFPSSGSAPFSPDQISPGFLSASQFNELMTILTLNEEGNLNMAYPQYLPK